MMIRANFSDGESGIDRRALFLELLYDAELITSEQVTLYHDEKASQDACTIQEADNLVWEWTCAAQSMNLISSCWLKK